MVEWVLVNVVLGELVPVVVRVVVLLLVMVELGDEVCEVVGVDEGVVLTVEVLEVVTVVVGVVRKQSLKLPSANELTASFRRPTVSLHPPVTLRNPPKLHVTISSLTSLRDRSLIAVFSPRTIASQSLACCNTKVSLTSSPQSIADAVSLLHVAESLSNSEACALQVRKSATARNDSLP